MFNKIYILILLALLIIVASAFAGTFTPTPSSPGASYYTLSDIYNKISAGTSAPAHTFDPATTPAETFVTLSQIWNIIPPHRTLATHGLDSGILSSGIYSATTSLVTIEPNLIAANIATGTSIFGVKGTRVVYTVTYNGNGNTGGNIPIDSNSYSSGNTVTVLDNTGALLKTGYNFTGWNTQANGGGIARATSSTFAIGSANVNLYARWTANTYTITYNGNTNTGGTVPANQTKTQDVTLTLATNSGTLVKSGYTFAGWNTAANGSGTDYAVGASYTANAAATLYAKWTPAPLLFTAVQAGSMSNGATFGHTSPGTAGVDFPLSTDSVDLAGFALTQGSITALVSLTNSVGNGILTLTDAFSCGTVTGAGINLNGQSIVQGANAWTLSSLTDTAGGGQLTITNNFDGGTVTDAKLYVNSNLTGTVIDGTITYSLPYNHSVPTVAIYIDSSGVMGDFVGTIDTTDGAGIANYGTIIDVSGTITINEDGGWGIDNHGTITDVSGVVTSSGYTGIYNDGTITNLSGTFTFNDGDASVIINSGTITDISGTVINNSGMNSSGIENNGTITNISGDVFNTNSGVGISNYGGISYISGTVTNSGVGFGIYNYSGIITDISGGVFNNTSSYCGISNSGTIADISGTVTNNSTGSGGVCNLSTGVITQLTGTFTAAAGSLMAIYNVNTIGIISGGVINNSGEGSSGIGNWGTITNISGTVTNNSTGSGIRNGYTLNGFMGTLTGNAPLIDNTYGTINGGTYPVTRAFANSNWGGTIADFPATYFLGE